MKTNNSKQSFKGIEAAGLIIIACFIVAICIYHFVFGNPANFMNNDPIQSSASRKHVGNYL